MNQILIGNFIQQRRKELGMTQKELGERLDVSDKAVSKWETGRSMPDSSVLLDLCSILEINVNELLSGERIKEENLKERIEENMLSLIKEGSEERQKSRWSIIGAVLGIMLLVLAMISVINMSGAWQWQFRYYLDIPSLLIVTGITLIVLAISGQFKNFFYGFKVSVTRNGSPTAIKQSVDAFKIAMLSNVFAGGFGFVTGFITFLTNITEPSNIGPALVVAVLSIFYPSVINLIILVFYARLKQICD